MYEQSIKGEEITYDLMKDEGYGVYTIIASSSNAKELEKIKENIFFKTYVKWTVVICFLVLFSSILIGGIVGVDSPNEYGFGPRTAGSFLGGIFGMSICIVVITIGIGAGSLDMEKEYKIRYRGERR